MEIPPELRERMIHVYMQGAMDDSLPKDIRNYLLEAAVTIDNLLTKLEEKPL